MRNSGVADDVAQTSEVSESLAFMDFNPTHKPPYCSRLIWIGQGLSLSFSLSLKKYGGKKRSSRG